MYWPLVGIGATIRQFLVAYRHIFCREAGFAHISRYINGLLLSANKTLQGSYAQIVWPEGEGVSRRAMMKQCLNRAGVALESHWSRTRVAQS
jgi:hypothetical protein